MANWYDMLKDAMELNGDRFEDRICTLSEDDLKFEFNEAWLGPEPPMTFVAWGEMCVYFPLKYDGKMSIGLVPRNPFYSSKGKLMIETIGYLVGGPVGGGKRRETSYPNKIRSRFF